VLATQLVEEPLEICPIEGKSRLKNLTVVKEIESNKSQDTQTPTLDCYNEEEPHQRFHLDTPSPLTSIALKRKGGLLNNKISR
jgi:hypothetical protein